jgi:DNA adenine methylase
MLWEKDILINASNNLKGKKIITGDFQKFIKKAKDKDLVYCDPIYTTTHNNNCFKRYNEKLFSWEDQIRLAEACKMAAKRGATVLISNAYHNDISDLYKDAKQFILTRKNNLCPNPKRRNETQECLFIFDH